MDTAQWIKNLRELARTDIHIANALLETKPETEVAEVKLAFTWDKEMALEVKKILAQRIKRSLS